MAKTNKPADFESSLKRLEELVTQMEQGDLPIEQALKAFEEGIALTRECQQILDTAEQKVQILVESRGELQEQPFNVDDPA